MKYGTRISICIVLSFFTATHAQERGKSEDARSQDDVRTEIMQLVRGQEEILAQLSELKRLFSASASARVATQMPITLNIHGDPFEGDSAASVAVIEYADFECPFCGGYEQQTYPKLFENYIKTGKVKLFYRDLPLPIHPHAMSAARASHCAGEQGKYWEMHDSLFANQSTLTDKGISDRAPALGMDEAKFTACLSSDKYTDEIHESMSEAQKLGVHATPTFFLGVVDASGDVVKISKTIVGAHPYADFQSALDELLASNNPEAVSAH